MSFETTTVILETREHRADLGDLEPARQLMCGLGVGALLTTALVLSVFVLF